MDTGYFRLVSKQDEMKAPLSRHQNITISVFKDFEGLEKMLSKVKDCMNPNEDPSLIPASKECYLSHLIAAGISPHYRICIIVYFEDLVTVYQSLVMLLHNALACGPDMAATLCFLH